MKRIFSALYQLAFCLLLTWGITLGVFTGGAQAQPLVPEKDTALNMEQDGSDKVVIFEEPHSLDKGSTLSPAVTIPTDRTVPGTEEGELPRIAIIIDDMGYHQGVGDELLELDLNLTFSFLPHAPFTQQQSEVARRKGRDVLVHMPMEPRSAKWDPGPGTLFLENTPAEITRTAEENIALVPYAIGVNNHMGSKFTADREAMQEVLAVLKEKGLFYVDSLTAPESVGAEEARNMGVKTGRRQIFLDNSHSQEDICRQLLQLVAHARKYGSAIGIGHPNRTTINALKLCRGMLRQQIRLVGIHELVH